MELRCAICERPVGERSINRFFPLCSERCRLVDLGKWLGGEYAIAGNPTNDYGASPFEPDEDEF